MDDSPAQAPSAPRRANAETSHVEHAGGGGRAGPPKLSRPRHQTPLHNVIRPVTSCRHVTYLDDDNSNSYPYAYWHKSWRGQVLAVPLIAPYQTSGSLRRAVKKKIMEEGPPLQKCVLSLSSVLSTVRYRLWLEALVSSAVGQPTVGRTHREREREAWLVACEIDARGEGRRRTMGPLEQGGVGVINDDQVHPDVEEGDLSAQPPPVSLMANGQLICLTHCGRACHSSRLLTLTISQSKKKVHEFSKLCCPLSLSLYLSLSSPVCTHPSQIKVSPST
ncbi:hypothetical protein BHE74_00037690 [Ensete ventricosum]|nr:hypothetical protein BHE74_00037690 [Ensete ventricosum]